MNEYPDLGLSPKTCELAGFCSFHRRLPTTKRSLVTSSSVAICSRNSVQESDEIRVIGPAITEVSFGDLRLPARLEAGVRVLSLTSMKASYCLTAGTACGFSVTRSIHKLETNSQHYSH